MPKTLLDKFRDDKYKEFNQDLIEFPPVSSQFLSRLEAMFTPEDINPGDPSMNQKLIIQHGIEKVLRFLRRANERQEKAIRETCSR